MSYSMSKARQAGQISNLDLFELKEKLNNCFILKKKILK
jgi:hypothetical protein